ncbi:MAG: hypothetical protein C7B46_19825 [Sulfobacillus benefaciens]|uniref:Cation/H+ exchanger transmembrane domain-containing protein n=1 Tax=Sulfobacillus benefaciens TaxID=453960 RepID=A0A2T2WWN8_9FIRM|nr:MAG: hypothetical protein C7B46_19825 [Sulfobacillus benefaciens]
MNSPAVAYAVLELGVLITSAKVLGWLFAQLRLPSVIGEFGAGVLWGKSLIEWCWPWLYHHVFPASLAPTSIKILSMATLFGFLVMLASSGADALPQAVKNSRAGIVTSFYVTSSWILSMFTGGVLVALAPMTLLTPKDTPGKLAFFIGICVAMSAVPIISRVINEYGIAGCPNGILLMRLSMIMDFIGWMMLALGALWFAHHMFNLAMVSVALRMVIGIVILIVIGTFIVSRLAEIPSTYWFWPTLFGYSAFTYFLAQVNLYIGGLLFGLALSRTSSLRVEIRRQFGGMAEEVFVPRFFCFIGYQSNAWVFSHASVDFLGLAILVMGIVVKALPALFFRWLGSTWREIALLTFTLNARGGMEIFAALWALAAGIFSNGLFSVITSTAIITAVTCPIVVRWYLHKPTIEEQRAVTNRVLLTSYTITHVVE